MNAKFNFLKILFQASPFLPPGVPYSPMSGLFSSEQFKGKKISYPNLPTGSNLESVNNEDYYSSQSRAPEKQKHNFYHNTFR